MKQMIRTNKVADIIVCILLSLIGILTLPLQGCKSVKKSQTSSSEAVKVVKSDSSSSLTWKTVDTTVTSDKTTVTEFTVTADSVDFYDLPDSDNIGIGSLGPYNGSSNIGIGKNAGKNMDGIKKSVIGNIKSAKGLKVTGKVTETAKAEKKGQTIDVKKEQAAVKSDSAVAKKQDAKGSTKKGWNFAWMWLLLIPAAALAWWKRGWIIEKCLKFVAWIT